MRIVRISACLLACAIAWPASAEEGTASSAHSRSAALLHAASSAAWTAPDVPLTTVRAPLGGHALQQARRGGRAAAPSIGTVGIGGLAGLSGFEIGPSFRYWINDRFGLQAHLGFAGDDLPGDDINYMRFEPTFIVAIGDFGDGAINVRPYAGGGLRVVRTDLGDFNDTDVKPVGVGGVEFGFREVRGLKVSAELSLSGDTEDFDFQPLDGPSFGGPRVSALVHYFFN